MAIPMPIVQDIRRLDRQGMSRAQIARRLHVDRGTVAKYADMEDCSPKPKADRRYGSKIDPYAHLVDEWLEADRLLPRKQRHTIRRVHDRLLAETDYDGEYSTTMRYVHRWREANRGVPDREGYVRLEWAAGSMQVDFGVARARMYFVKSVFRVGAGAVLLDSSLIPSPPIMPQDRARVDDP